MRGLGSLAQRRQVSTVLGAVRRPLRRNKIRAAEEGDDPAADLVLDPALPYPACVRRVWIDPDIQILRTAGNAVDGHGVRADDEEAGVGVQQGREEFEPVVGHDRRATLTGISDLE